MTDTAQVHERYTEGPLLSCEAASLRSQAAVTRRPPYCPCLPPVAVSPAPGAVHPSIQVSSGDYGPYRPPRRSRRAGAPDFAPMMTCWTTPVPPAPTASCPNTSICRSATGCPWRKDHRHDRVQGDGVRDQAVAPVAETGRTWAWMYSVVFLVAIISSTCFQGASPSAASSSRRLAYAAALAAALRACSSRRRCSSAFFRSATRLSAAARSPVAVRTDPERPVVPVLLPRNRRSSRACAWAPSPSATSRRSPVARSERACTIGPSRSSASTQ